MKNLNFTKKYTDRKTINSNNSVKFEVNWPRGSYVRARHVKWTDSRTLVYHNTSRLKKTDRHDITEILLEVALNTINQTNKHQTAVNFSAMTIVQTFLSSRLFGIFCAATNSIPSLKFVNCCFGFFHHMTTFM